MNDQSFLTTLVISHITGVPIFAPSFSPLAPFVQENGLLNEAGRAIAEEELAREQR